MQSDNLHSPKKPADKRIKTKALKAAFPHTIPVLTGFAFLGIAYGLLMNSKGYGVGWTLLMSLFVFAGSAQYVAITFLTSVFNPLHALLMTLIINARHLFYGIAMLDRFKNTGRLKPYLIFALCDETFSVLCAKEPPAGVEKRWFMFFVALLNHTYWVAGSVTGALLGSTLSFNTKGLDFVLTALFVVIFIDQWKQQKNHAPALIGLLCSTLALVVFGADYFVIPAMIALLAGLALYRKRAEKGETL
ncbi:MAG: branched-chain amino acid ABC transporter permease [Clostridiales bacterium]|nr:branched-chain amino acid ABC transporter permease [Clostridiales bacterium]